MKSLSIDDAKKELTIEIERYMHIFDIVVEHVRVDVFEDKELIINSQIPLDRLFLLIEGKAKITMIHENGSCSIVYFVKPNELIGELTLIDIEKQAKDVISIGKSVCLSVPIELVKSTLLNSNHFMILLSQFIGIKLLDRTWFNAKQQQYDLKHRLAAYILLCECDGIYNENHVQTAEYLAVSYRHLLYVLKQFKEEGLLIKVKGGYKISKLKLEALASVLE